MGFSENYWSSVKISLSICFHCIWFIHWYASFKIFFVTVWIPLANRGWSRLWQRYDITQQSAVWVFISLHALYSFVFIVLSKYNHAVQVYTPNYLFVFCACTVARKASQKLGALYLVSMHIKPKRVLFNVAFQFCPALQRKWRSCSLLGKKKNIKINGGCGWYDSVHKPVPNLLH